MKKAGLMLLGSVIFSLPVAAQNISGIIKDHLSKYMSGSTISLLDAKDSGVFKLALSNEDGKFIFGSVKKGRYLISASHVGYKTVYSVPFDFSGSEDISIHVLKFCKLAGEIEGVVVTASKPLVEVKADKTILNVEGTISAVGSDGLELLRKAPGVSIDKDDNISLAGKNGVQVYINGKPTPLAGADLAANLKSIQSATIEAIEIITNPSAKYDAAGNAGIINIRLKKNQAFGTNGSINGGYAVGIYPKYNGGLSLNHRNKKINIYGTYNFNRNRNEINLQMYRVLLDTLFDQGSVLSLWGENHNFKTGIDYYAGNKSIFGVMINGSYIKLNSGVNSSTPISYIPTRALTKTLVADNDANGERTNINYNLNYRFADTAGHEFNLDADLGNFRIRTNQLQRNYYFDVSNNLYDTRIYQFITPSDIDIYTLKTDYSFGKNTKIGVGGKTSLVEANNDFNRYEVQAMANLFDSTRSNGFDYRENINSLYVNVNTQFKNFKIQIGLRVENTTSEGKSNGFMHNGNAFEAITSSFRRSYTDVFPSGAFTFGKNPNSQWGLRYSRRIDRPAYQDLNPFEFKLDEYTYQKGNTELAPQYTNSFAITHVYKVKLSSTLNYSHVSDVFTQLVDTTERSKSFLIKKNLATQDVFSLTVNYPFKYRTYSAVVNGVINYSQYEADFGPGRVIDLHAFAYNIFMQQSLRFKKVYTAELSGWYNSRSIWAGTFKIKALWSLDAGLMRTFWQNKVNVKISVSDVLGTLRWKQLNEFSVQYLRSEGRPEATQFKVNFTYRFGNSQLKNERQRNSGLDEESKRVQ